MLEVERREIDMPINGHMSKLSDDGTVLYPFVTVLVLRAWSLSHAKLFGHD